MLVALPSAAAAPPKDVAQGDASPRPATSAQPANYRGPLNIAVERIVLRPVGSNGTPSALSVDVSGGTPEKFNGTALQAHTFTVETGGFSFK